MNGNSVTIEVLNGSNFKKWKEDFLFAMELADVHIALNEDRHTDLEETIAGPEKAHFAAWEKSYKLCLLSLKRSIQEHLKSGLPTDCTAKQMMEALQSRYRVSSNAKVGTLIQQLFNMLDLHTKLNALGTVIPENVLVYQALNILPSEFGIIKTNFNSQDEAWSINNLISRAISREEKLKKDAWNFAMVAISFTNRKGKKPKPYTHKDTCPTTGQSGKLSQKKASFKKDSDRCFFCNKMGHMKKDCTKNKN
ncbi:uncharacterized protein J3R85_008255 [Psidium guajava]|nr:uncharacterized protein J3R85_008255 [Psidium guajava]